MLSQEKVFDDRDEWRLLADELSLLPGMTVTGRLGFALQLKFRQVQGHYPDSVHDFPSGIVHTIAGQVGCASISPENYTFQGRQAQRHRQHIRRYLGVRLPNKADIIRVLRRHPSAIRYSMVAMFCCRRRQQLTDALIEMLMVLIHNLGTRAEKKVDKKQFAAFKKVRGKARLLFRMAEATVDQPDGVIK